MVGLNAPVKLHNFSCDTIMGPIVLLKDGVWRELILWRGQRKLGSIRKILYLGDLLSTYGDLERVLTH